MHWDARQSLLAWEQPRSMEELALPFIHWLERNILLVQALHVILFGKFAFLLD